jgi:hypothetical protein
VQVVLDVIHCGEPVEHPTTLKLICSLGWAQQWQLAEAIFLSTFGNIIPPQEPIWRPASLAGMSDQAAALLQAFTGIDPSLRHRAMLTSSMQSGTLRLQFDFLNNSYPSCPHLDWLLSGGLTTICSPYRCQSQIECHRPASKRDFIFSSGVHVMHCMTLDRSWSCSGLPNRTVPMVACS